MTQAKKDSGHEEVLSILQTSRNRLEYLTPNDWTLIVDRAKRSAFRKGETLLQHGKQTRTVYLLLRGTAGVEIGCTTALTISIVLSCGCDRGVRSCAKADSPQRTLRALRNAGKDDLKKGMVLFQS